MNKLRKYRWIGVFSLTLFIIFVVVFLTLYMTTNVDKPTEVADDKVWGTETLILDDTVGVEFTCPKTWVVERNVDVSQVSMFELLSYYNNKTDYNGYSITTSYVESDFNLKDFVAQLYDAYSKSESVSSAEYNELTINGNSVYQIQLVSDGAFGGIEYIKNDNVVVELVYCTQSADKLDSYTNNAANLIKSMKFKTVTKDDFPKISSETEKSDVESSVTERSNDNSSMAEKSDTESKPDTEIKTDSESDNNKLN